MSPQTLIDDEDTFECPQRRSGKLHDSSNVPSSKRKKEKTERSSEMATNPRSPKSDPSHRRSSGGTSRREGIESHRRASTSGGTSRREGTESHRRASASGGTTRSSRREGTKRRASTASEGTSRRDNSGPSTESHRRSSDYTRSPRRESSGPPTPRRKSTGHSSEKNRSSERRSSTKKKSDVLEGDNSEESSSQRRSSRRKSTPSSSSRSDQKPDTNKASTNALLPQLLESDEDKPLLPIDMETSSVSVLRQPSVSSSRHQPDTREHHPESHRQADRKSSSSVVSAADSLYAIKQNTRTSAHFDPRTDLFSDRRTLGSENTDDTVISSKFSSPIERFLDEDGGGHVSILIEKERPTKSKSAMDFTNDPHPALETPLVYFLLRRHPKLLNIVVAFYNFRWDITYPLQNRIPGTRWLQKLKIIMTWGELFLLVPIVFLLFYAMSYTFIEPDVAMSGHVSRTPLILAYLTAMKNNWFTFFLGMSVERCIKYHKVAACLAYVNGLMHTYVAYMDHVNKGHFGDFLFETSLNAGGTMLVLVMTLMVVMAQPYIRSKLFELFYLVHIVCAVGMMACAYYHTGILVPLLGSCTWGLDLVIRKVYMPFFRYPRKAKLQIISDSVVELSFLKQDGMDFNPGQYIYIAVPKLSIIQWHPFSLSSSSRQKVVTLHIRVGGNWTGGLYALAKQQKEVDILLEGPYGSVQVDFTNPYKYQTVMLFSGGIGVTPMQSLCNSLMYEHNHGTRKLRKLSFVWIERDPIMMPEVDVVRRESMRHQRDAPPKLSRNDALEISTRSINGATTLAQQLLSQIPAGRDTDKHLKEAYKSAELELQNDDELETETNFDTSTPLSPFLEDAQNKQGKKEKHQSSNSVDDESFMDYAFRGDDDNTPIDLQVYLTNKKLSHAARQKLPPFVTIGRPDFDNIFRQARHDALRNHQHRVAICVCAPQRIVDLCRKGCAKYSDRYVAFDFHSEVFS